MKIYLESNLFSRFAKHFLVMIVVILCGRFEVYADNPWGVRVGAIRWDAWYGDSYATPRVTKSLSPYKYWDRLPFFSQIGQNNYPYINGNSHSTMANELYYANKARIDYWAFLDYPNNSGLDRAIDLYLDQVNNQGVDFCVILTTHSYYESVSAQTGTGFWQKMENFLKSPRYEKVKNQRPLIYLYKDLFKDQKKKGIRENFLNHIDAISQKISGVKPYYILLSNPSKSTAKKAKNFSLDGISSYHADPHLLGVMNNMTYANFTHKINDKFNNKLASLAKQFGLEFVPFASVGWNPSPRLKCGKYCFGNLYGSTNYIVKGASPEEISSHIRNMVGFSAYHSQAQGGSDRAFAPAKHLLIYAWNEFDEGGWLAPTYDPLTGGIDESRIEALSHGLGHL
jgi:hypothetical protein